MGHSHQRVNRNYSVLYLVGSTAELLAHIIKMNKTNPLKQITHALRDSLILYNMWDGLLYRNHFQVFQMSENVSSILSNKILIVLIGVSAAMIFKNMSIT